MPGAKVTVFEAVNETLSELYVGSTELSVHDLIARNAARPPAEIAHWGPEHRVDYRSLEFGLEPASARDFIVNYAAALAKGARRVIVAP